MRPLFSWQRNHVGCGHLVVLLAVAVCCLYGCAVSSGGRAPKDLNERNIAVLVLARDPDPYSWRGAKKAFTPLTNREADGLEGELLKEVEGLGLFEHVTRYEDPLTYNLKPAYELSMYGAWFARHEKESITAKEFVDVPVPAWVAETSEREIVSQRGLMARYELKDRRSGEIVAQWYSFSAASFHEEKRPVIEQTHNFLEEEHWTIFPVLSQTLLEEEHRATLQRKAASVVADDATRGSLEKGGSMPPPLPAGNSEFVAQVPAESGLLIAGRSTHQLEWELERFTARGDELHDSSFFVYFGTIDVSYIREQTADLHQSLVSALVEQIGESPMRYFPWGGDYKLVFDITALNFWHTYGAGPQATSTAEISVWLIHLSERRVLFEQTPPLIVSVQKPTLGGKQPMAPLCQEAAKKIAQLLKDYLAAGHGGTP